MRRSPLPVALFLAVLGAAPVARATVLVEVPLDDMVFAADAIVMGEVVHVGTRLVTNGQRTEPWTMSTIRVDRWLKGGSGATVEIAERGGTWQGGGMRIAGTPVYRTSERVVVFLRRDPEGRLRTYGMVQGRFTVRAAVDGPTVVERDLSDAAFASWQGGQMTVGHLPPTEMTLAALLSRIEWVLASVEAMRGAP